jgi:hypothetical protein
MEFNNLKNTVKKRLLFIESRLFWEGSVSRGDIVNFFNISEPQATNDLITYHNFAPHNCTYNKSLKLYEKTKNFSPIISEQSSKGYLNRLLFSRRRIDGNEFFCGKIPPYSEVPILDTVTNDEILKTVLKAIQNNMALNVKYQSDTRPNPIWRWITPHAIGFNGLRWHVRALCHEHKEYRDFVLPRIISLKESVQHSFDHDVDYEWHQEIQLLFIANDMLAKGKKQAVELEYGMIKGKLSIDVKAAFYYYLKKRYWLNDEENITEKNKLILVNKKEAEFQIEVLKSMANKKINQNFNFDYKLV